MVMGFGIEVMLFEVLIGGERAADGDDAVVPNEAA